jgi:hypothetical protein
MKIIQMKIIYSSLLLLALFLTFTGCSLANGQHLIEQTHSPKKATDTAIVSRKYTEIAEATLYPSTSFPTELFPTMDWTSWTPEPGEIVASDSGKAFNFVLTSRFSIVLKRQISRQQIWS